MRYIITVMVALLFLALAAPAAAGQCDDPVNTAEGQVLGKTSGPACAWLGVPYAAPPTGHGRFRPPAPAYTRTHLFAATDFGPACVQNESISSGGKSKTMSEDCLTLNIFRPQKSGSFPVMFWIHGGAFTQGAGSYEMYDGSALAGTQDVVVVTINYRLGPFGFLALPELTGEDGAVGAGNYGLLDQIAALEWVRDNIANFGGDPKNVTIFGESAGGVSVCALLASGPAAGLFHRAIMESGACDMTESLPDGYTAGRKLAAELGCPADDARDCLRKLSAATILKAAKKMSASAHLDGKVLTDQPVNLIRAGTWNQVPVMTGSTRDEMAMLIYLKPWAGCLSRRRVEDAIRKTVPKRADDILGMYKFEDYGRPVRVFGAIIADAFGSRALALAQVASPAQPVYWYRFDWDEERGSKIAGSFHGLELPFVFGNLELKNSPLGLLMKKKGLPEARKLSAAMMAYWANFARAGNPNGQGLPEWKPFTAEDPERIVLDTTITAGRPQADEWKRLSYYARVALSEFDLSAVMGK